MNIFGKNIDKKAIDTIAQLLNTPEGQKLKQELMGLDKQAVMDKFKNMNITNADIENFSSQLSAANKEELLKKMRSLNLDNLKKE